MSVGYPALLCGGLDFGTFPTIQYLGGFTYYDVGVPPVVWIPPLPPSKCVLFDVLLSRTTQILYGRKGAEIQATAE